MPVTSIQQGDPYMRRMEEAYYQMGASRLNPRMEQEQAALENQLQQQGLTRGSSAWNAEMDRQMRARNDAYSGLSNQAILNSGAEAARLQGMDINAGNFANQAAQQNFLNQGLSQQWQNAALGQQFGQNLAAGQFGNQAQQQEFGQGAFNATLRNQAMGAQGDLAERAAARAQQASQFAQSYDLQNRAQQAQMDQFAASLGMTGRQLDAQIGQWAAANGLTREQMANQLLIAREGNAASRANAADSRAAAMAGISAQRDMAQRNLDFQREQWQYGVGRQSAYDPYILQNLILNGYGPSLGGTQLATSPSTAP
jgi:hypothetical protein